MSRRTKLADAALRVVADRGLKGLTHRAVDTEASVAPGTTSNYFSTRAALEAAVLDRLEEQSRKLLGASSAVGPPASIAAFAAQLAAVTVALARRHARLTKVRFALALDRPAEVGAAHRRMVARVEAVLSFLGVAQATARAFAVADYTDGLIFHAVTARRRERLDPEEIAATIVRIASGA